MKNVLWHIIFFLFLTCSLPLQAQQQRVTLEGNLTLEEAFRIIEQQTGAIISYNRSRLDTSQPRTLALANSRLEPALRSLLENSGFTYRLKQTGQLHILIVPAKGIPKDLPQAVTLTDKPAGTGTASGRLYLQPAAVVVDNPLPASPEELLPVPSTTLPENKEPLRFSVVQTYTGSPVGSIPFRVEFLKRPEYQQLPRHTSLYSQAPIKIVSGFTMAPAITVHYFHLNRDLYIEPRLQLLWKVVSGHTLAVRYGLQTRQGYTTHYKPWQPGMPDLPVHPQLTFTRSHHIAATYQWQPAPHKWIQATGGLLLQPGQANALPAHRFMVKLLAGRDWQLTPGGSQSLSANLRVVWLPGNRQGTNHEPVTRELPAGHPDDLQNKVMPNAPLMESGLTLNYRISQQRVTHDFSVKILTTSFTRKNLYPYQVRVEKGEPVNKPAVVPNVSYQITF
ncbi:MAG: STN domain-containing protein [Tannerellaceae bacterium]|nr:STN domain-containing protein [Tannerellaceae bacterium]